MARAGIPCPSAEGDRRLVRLRLADIGDEQSLARSLSTFSAHVQRLCALLERRPDRGLILLDELASGTDPEEGAALAAAMLEALTARGRGRGRRPTTKAERVRGPRRDLQNASVSYDFERMAPTFRLTMGYRARRARSR